MKKVRRILMLFDETRNETRLDRLTKEVENLKKEIEELDNLIKPMGKTVAMLALKDMIKECEKKDDIINY